MIATITEPALDESAHESDDEKARIVARMVKLAAKQTFPTGEGFVQPQLPPQQPQQQQHQPQQQQPYVNGQAFGQQQQPQQ